MYTTLRNTGYMWRAIGAADQWETIAEALSFALLSNFVAAPSTDRGAVGFDPLLRIAADLFPRQWPSQAREAGRPADCRNRS